MSLLLFLCCCTVINFRINLLYIFLKQKTEIYFSHFGGLGSPGSRGTSFGCLVRAAQHCDSKIAPYCCEDTAIIYSLEIRWWKAERQEGLDAVSPGTEEKMGRATEGFYDSFFQTFGLLS